MLLTLLLYDMKRQNTIRNTGYGVESKGSTKFCFFSSLKSQLEKATKMAVIRTVNLSPSETLADRDLNIPSTIGRRL